MKINNENFTSNNESVEAALRCFALSRISMLVCQFPEWIAGEWRQQLVWLCVLSEFTRLDRELQRISHPDRNSECYYYSAIVDWYMCVKQERESGME